MPLTYVVTSKQLGPQQTAVVRGEMRSAEMTIWLPEAYHAVFAHLQRLEIEPTGPPFARFTFLGDLVVIEAGVPVVTQVAVGDRVEPSRLPEGPAAVTTHVGRYEDLDQAVGAVTQWLAEHSLEPVGSHWEIYYTDPNAEPDPSRWRTDVVIPYRAS